MKAVHLHTPRWKIIGFILFFGLIFGTLLASDVRASMMAEHGMGYWVPVAFFGALFLASLFMIKLYPKLILDEDGFEYRTGFNSNRVAWIDTGPLSLHSQKIRRSTIQSIVFDRLDTPTLSQHQRVNKAYTGYTDGIVANFNIRAETQLKLMKDYRDAAIKRSEADKNE